jgi:hypothetical protein
MCQCANVLMCQLFNFCTYNYTCQYSLQFIHLVYQIICIRKVLGMLTKKQPVFSFLCFFCRYFKFMDEINFAFSILPFSDICSN